MLRILMGAALAALAMFAWGFVSWAVLDWHKTSGYQLPNEAAVVAALKQGDTETGVYWIPGISPDVDMMGGKDEAAIESWTKRHEEGPVGLLAFQAEGREPMGTMMHVRGLALYFGIAFVAALLLASAGIRSFFGRLAFVVGLGVLAAIGQGFSWNYMYFPLDWTQVQAIDLLVAHAVGGFALALFVTPKDS